LWTDVFEAYVSMQRIEGYLDEPEVPEWASSLKKRSEQEYTYKTAFDNAMFAYPSPPQAAAASRRFVLGPLDIEFPRGQLTLVSGGTSSGKSALLASLLGGMRQNV
jgi:ABC-type siderophore export system fused ATPase/permease subunit